MDQKREDENPTAFWVRAIRNSAIEEAAQMIDNNEVIYVKDEHGGGSFELGPRRKGNLAGVAYAAAIRALKDEG